jgi:hypothetical protein
LEKKLFPGIRSSIAFMEVYITLLCKYIYIEECKEEKLCQVMADEKEMIMPYGHKP